MDAHAALGQFLADVSSVLQPELAQGGFEVRGMEHADHGNYLQVQFRGSTKSLVVYLSQREGEVNILVAPGAPPWPVDAEPPWQYIRTVGRGQEPVDVVELLKAVPAEPLSFGEQLSQLKSELRRVNEG